MSCSYGCAIWACWFSFSSGYFVQFLYADRFAFNTNFDVGNGQLSIGELQLPVPQLLWFIFVFFVFSLEFSC